MDFENILIVLKSNFHLHSALLLEIKELEKYKLDLMEDFFHFYS